MHPCLSPQKSINEVPSNNLRAKDVADIDVVQHGFSNKQTPEAKNKICSGLCT